MVRAIRPLLLISVLLSLATAAPAAAAADKGDKPKAYVIKGHGPDGKPFEKKIDPKNVKDVNELARHIAEQEAEEIVAEKSVNLMDLRIDLGLWTVVVFLLLYMILKKTAWAPMLDALKKREDTIAGSLESARKMAEDAEKKRQEWQVKFDNAAQEIRAMMEEARRDGQKLKDEMTNTARTEIQTERDRLRREIEMAKDQALQDIWGQTAQLATLVSAKTIKRELNSDDHRRLVDEALAEMRSAAEGRRDTNWGDKA